MTGGEAGKSSDLLELLRHGLLERQDIGTVNQNIGAHVQKTHLGFRSQPMMNRSPLPRLSSLLKNVLASLKELRVIIGFRNSQACLLYTSPSPRDATLSRMPSSA